MSPEKPAFPAEQVLKVNVFRIQGEYLVLTERSKQGTFLIRIAWTNILASNLFWLCRTGLRGSQPVRETVTQPSQAGGKTTLVWESWDWRTFYWFRLREVTEAGETLPAPLAELVALQWRQVQTGRGHRDLPPLGLGPCSSSLPHSQLIAKLGGASSHPLLTPPPALLPMLPAENVGSKTWTRPQTVNPGETSTRSPWEAGVRPFVVTAAASRGCEGALRTPGRKGSLGVANTPGTIPTPPPREADVVFQTRLRIASWSCIVGDVHGAQS